jgi:hypothetical protein
MTARSPVDPFDDLTRRFLSGASGPSADVTGDGSDGRVTVFLDPPAPRRTTTILFSPLPDNCVAARCRGVTGVGRDDLEALADLRDKLRNSAAGW